ncbi:hypothetical protein TNCV_1275661 [Trichonephila clavipes]|nr:hypothetical protein TNCV_1275661 [Trichonephila clavipes]
MDKGVQMLDKNFGTLVQTTRVCICVLRTNRTREAERDFCGLPMRREPCQGSKELGRESPGWRELEESAKEKRLGPRLEWKGRKDVERRWRWRIGVI